METTSNPSLHFVFCINSKRMIAVLGLLILRAGAVPADRYVTFENPNPCAVEGSSVKFRCSYTYDFGSAINTAWYKGETRNGTWTRVKLSDLPSYENRSEYVGDLQQDCSLALHDLQPNDTGYYYFRFDTESYGWRSRESVYLSVTELSATVNPDTVRVGDSVTLGCRTSCQLHSTAVWFKDGRLVAKPEFQAQAEDAGNYFCAFKGQESLQSDPVALNVQYPPLNVSVEVSYPSILTANSAVNLTCSSSANPAAENYTWYKRTPSPSSSFLLQVGSGQVLSLPSEEASHTGLYLCQAGNALGENTSTGVLLSMKDDFSTIALHQTLLRAGFGLKVVILLVLPLIVICCCKRRQSKSAVDKEENDRDFENFSAARS
uniref:B-cell receptor CD22-like isoform X2 n=1 Tax=Semicossyphus pulcher TaxID=241346 RepID=UPI0037E8F62B